MNSSIYGCYWVVFLENEKEDFIEAWYQRKFGISDRVYEALEPVFENVLYCLMNNIEDKIESGNYSIKLVNQIEIYNLFLK